MRRVVILAILALALPIAAWADGITLINEFGSISISNAGITTKGSELLAFNNVTAPAGHSLGTVAYTTGALVSGTIQGGGVFSTTGSSFTVTGRGNYGEPKGVIFSGAFVNTPTQTGITWTLVSQQGQKLTYNLTGSIEGMLYTGRMVSGTTTQTIFSTNGQISQGIGHIRVGETKINTPEPGTLGLLGTGLIGIAGVFRRRKAA